ncbi:hypothetical protein GCM10009535_52600 [Streptomyces thermocarboxydovorans]|uniref:Uncharacterized protein n=1 Tax=Streptomyces thermocarboxydovorans TaxID=59298 RepID=A0ABP3SZ76_9ACTN
MTVPALLEAVSLRVPDELVTPNGLTVNDILGAPRPRQVGNGLPAAGGELHDPRPIPAGFWQMLTAAAGDLPTGAQDGLVPLALPRTPPGHGPGRPDPPARRRGPPPNFVAGGRSWVPYGR